MVVLDDLRCPDGAAVRAAVAAAGCRRLYLPAYSPDPTPVELACARLKRRLRSDGPRDVPAPPTFPGSAASACRPDGCRRHIGHGGYGEPAATAGPNQR